MGYRSTVAISLFEKDFKYLCEEIKRHEIKDNRTEDSLRSLFLNADIDIQDRKKGQDSIVTILIEDVKWYPGYKDVDYIMEFLRKKAERYSFKRIGEEYDDFEQEGNDEDCALSDNVYPCLSFYRESEGRIYCKDEKKKYLRII